MDNNPLNRVIAILKTQSALADAVGVKQPNVWNWIHRDGGRVPPEKVLAVSRAVKWVITPHQLRPDLYPNPSDGLPCEGEGVA